MTTRAKFEVYKVSEMGYGGKRQEISQVDQKKGETGPDGKVLQWDTHKSSGVPIRLIEMNAVYGDTEENRSFATATPSGTITFQLNNPALADEFKPGQAYYVEFIPVPVKES